MSEYIEQYFNLLVNSSDVNVVKELLPCIVLDKTNQIIEQLVSKLNEEVIIAEEFNDREYLLYLKEVILLLSERKEKVIEEDGVLDNNIIIFSHDVIKTIKKLNDPFYYSEILHAIESLKSKQWMESNQNNSEKYKRLHGVAYGLSEVKTKKIRLIHMPINGDFWYVSEILKKDGDNPKNHQNKLQFLCKSCKDDVDTIRKEFTLNGQLDYDRLIKYSQENNEIIMEMINKLGGRKK